MTQNIKDIRLNLGLSKEQLSRILNVSHKSIYNYESGKSKPIPVIQEKIERLARKVNKS